MFENLQLDAPNLGDLEKEYLMKAVDSNFVSTAGPFVTKFEQDFTEYLGTKACVSAQSGTAALHVALYQLRIGQGDEVILPALTFAATINAVLYVGAIPVIVDVDEATWNISPVEIERALTPRTKAIIPVHLYGNPCRMDKIMSIARQHGLFVIEDATESLGATFGGRMTGTIGDIGCFSFNGNKVITTGGGGMIATNNLNWAEHMKFLVNQARDGSRSYYYYPEVGFNYRMTNLEAALGLAQLERLPQFLAKKRMYFQIYSTALAGVEGLHFQEMEEGAVSTVWLSSITIDRKRGGMASEELQEKLKAKGIPTRRIFPPLVDSPPYRKFGALDYPNARRIFESGLNLPSSTLNDPNTIEQVAETILGIIK